MASSPRRCERGGAVCGDGGGPRRLVCMGAPNFVRGELHCEILSAREAFAEGLVDMLCSDYHFPSLLGIAVRMIARSTAP